MLPKKSVQALKGYQTKDITYRIKLDANEATQNVLDDFKDSLPTSLFRYPDNYAHNLRAKAAKYYNIEKENMIAGNGSSEMLELILKTYLEKDDIVLGFEPSFTMFRVFTEIYSGRYISLDTKAPFNFKAEAMIKAAETYRPKLIILCSPNNPTGQIMPVAAIQNIIENTEALVLVDEAYIEFYNPKNSMIKKLKTYKRLIVLRSLSKAFGLAGIRLGFLFANAEIIQTLNTVKSPYNINSLSQALGAFALDNPKRIQKHLEAIKTERTRILKKLQSLGINVFSSYANFIFFQSPIPNLFEKLLKKGILIRDFSGDLSAYYRVSIGTPTDNTQFIQALKEVSIDARN